MRTYYFVTTRHPTGYQDGTHEFRVSADRDGFYAVAKGFGCSKTYATEEGAIRAMCEDHACAVVSLVKVEATQ